jgi:hypothetical protein
MSDVVGEQSRSNTKIHRLFAESINFAMLSFSGRFLSQTRY